jgi:hypothetical protein
MAAARFHDLARIPEEDVDPRCGHEDSRDDHAQYARAE